MYIKNFVIKNFGSIKNFSCDVDRTYQEILGDEQFVNDFYFLACPSAIENSEDFATLVTPQTEVAATLVSEQGEKTFVWQNNNYFIISNGQKRQADKKEFIFERTNFAFEKTQPVIVVGKENVKHVQDFVRDIDQTIVINKA